MIEFLFTQTPLKFLVQSLWRDEAFSILLAKRDIVDILILTARDFNPPLYYLLLKSWMIFFGATEIAVRSLSLVFFWATVYVFYLILSRHFRIPFRKIIIYLLLIALNPFLLYYAFEARMYIHLAFLTILSYYFLLRMKILPYVIAVLAGLYTHYFMVFVLLSQIIGILLTTRGSKRNAFYKALSLILFLFAPWGLFFLWSHQGASGNFWIPALTAQDILTSPGVLYSAYEKGLDFYDSQILPLTAMLVATICAGTLILIRKANKSIRSNYFMFLLLAIVPPLSVFVLSIFKPLFFPRYLISASIGIIMLIVLSLEYMPRRLAAVAWIILLLFTLQYHFLQIESRGKTNWRPIVAEIQPLLREGDVIYVTSALDFHIAQYYFGAHRIHLYNVNPKDVPAYVGRVIIPDDRFARALPSYPNRAYVLESDGRSYRIQSLY